MHPVFLHGGGGDVDVDAADGSVFVLDGIDGVDALEDVLDGVVHRVFAGFDGQPLVAHVLQGDDFVSHFLLRQLLARYVAVLPVVGAVDAAVDAVVGQIQRREHDDAVAVELLLDLPGQRGDLRLHLGVFIGQQHGGFAVGKPLALARLVEDGADEGHVVLVQVGVGECVLDLLMVDELLRLHGLYVVHGSCSPFFRVSAASPSGNDLWSPRAMVTR